MGTGGKTHLHETTHDAVTEEELIATERHRRDDGMVRSFATLQDD